MYLFDFADLLSEGDPVQFEAVPAEGGGGSEGGGGANPSNSYCTWFANLVWKGKRPAVESTFKNAQLASTGVSSEYCLKGKISQSSFLMFSPVTL